MTIEEAERIVKTQRTIIIRMLSSIKELEKQIEEYEKLLQVKIEKGEIKEL